MTHFNEPHESSGNPIEQATIKLRWKRLKVQLLTGIAIIDIFLIGMFFLYSCIIVLGLKSSWQAAQVQHVVVAGRVLSTVSIADGGQVETELGYFFLQSPLSVFKSAPLTLETRDDQHQYLCTPDHACTRLLGPSLTSRANTIGAK